MTLDTSSQTISDIPDDINITRVSLSGFMSYKTMQTIQILPLTILAGANSAGKSSAIKSLLLLKQTLDSTTDPGPLQIWGPNVRFELISQLLTDVSPDSSMDTITIDIYMKFGGLRLQFSRISDFRIGVKRAEYQIHDQIPAWTHKLELDPRMSSAEIEMQLPESTRTYFSSLSATSAPAVTDQVGHDNASSRFLYDPIWSVRHDRCFLTAVYASLTRDVHKIDLSSHPSADFSRALKSILHISSARNIPDRHHQALDVQSMDSGLPGLFESYTASIMQSWRESSDGRLDAIRDSLRELRLTTDLSTSRRGDTAVEVYVARPQSSAPSPISLADVGLGVAHVLPVLVALESASPGQLVYLEHPESHLHPRAAYGLAIALARAARRGVRVVAETHSSLLLLHIQTLIARGELDPAKVGFNWFSLDSEGFTNVEFVKPDEHGRTGDWPEDFADTEMDASSAFLRAARQR